MATHSLPSSSRFLYATLLFLVPSTLLASGFGLFQHGGRGAGQAGAWTARADTPFAASYNAAGIAWVEGFAIEGGLDFAAPRDDFKSGNGDFAARHQIPVTPAVYVTWRSSPASDWNFGLGIDSPFWTAIDWLPVEFPLRTAARRFELTLLELHPVVAWRLDDHWSFGAGVRYLAGSLDEGRTVLLAAGRNPGTFFVLGDKSYEADVDGLGFDLGVQYRDVDWGFGASLRSGVEVDGSSRGSVEVISFVPPDVADQVAGRILAERRIPGTQGFELAPELRAGVWLAPYPELRLELDISYQAWSETDNVNAQPLACIIVEFCGFEPRDWDDTLSVRLGVEGDLGSSVLLYGGLAFEPSPIPADRLEPGLPRGDAWVYAIGASYEFPHISFDLGYSLHQHEETGRDFEGRFEARDQVFAVSVRRRFGS